MWSCPKCGEKIEDQFDSCWRCAAAPEEALEPIVRLGWQFFLVAALAALFTPLLADGVQSLFEVRPYQRIYSFLYLGSTWGASVFVGLRAILTFLAPWCFAKLGFRDRTVWICLAVLWFVVDLMVMPAPHK
jgi:hypothetical protein